MEKPLFNMVIMALTALVPMVIGFIWYSPMVFGKTWMSSAGLTEEKVKGGNMPLILGLSYVFSLFLAMALGGIVIHQNGLFSIFQGDQNAEGLAATLEFLNTNVPSWGTNFRTFGHGAIHGVFTGIFVVLPIIATNALFERKSFKYIMVNWGYWVVTLILMGGIICQFS